MDPEPLKKLDIYAVMKKKDEIEGEIRESHGVLQTQGDVGMKGPLVDNEGYPRSDIDVYAVRQARNKIIRLQNDHKVVMKVIEEKLYQIHSEAKLAQSQGEETPSDTPLSEGRVFLVVKEVTPSSPAANAGLQTEDTILEFGSVNVDNFKSMSDVATVVQYSQNNPLRVVLVRSGKSQAITLIPKRWSGPGLLGCRLVPIERQNNIG
jgi:26S proteasome non-ATPase regulatory subunit 9